MRWGDVNWTIAVDAYDDHTGASLIPRLRPRTWAEVCAKPWSDPNSDPLGDIANFKVALLA